MDQCVNEVLTNYHFGVFSNFGICMSEKIETFSSLRTLSSLQARHFHATRIIFIFSLTWVFLTSPFSCTFVAFQR